MKRLIAIGMLISSSAFGSESNQAMKDCLDAHGYEPGTIKFYNFGPASKCFLDWKQGKLGEKYINMKLFLQENPWYNGSNWNWERCAKDSNCNHRTIKRY